MMPARFVHLRAGHVSFFSGASINPKIKPSASRRKPMMRYRFAVPLFCLILVSSAWAQKAPPKEENKREADLRELVKLDKSIKLDIRYATNNNFVGRVVYPEARAFLQRPAAE